MSITCCKRVFQGRLTIKIAALKMSKFGSSALLEAGSCVPLATRCHANSALCDTMPHNVAPQQPHLRAGNVASAAMGDHSSNRHEVSKVKTAAERKTYVDVPATVPANKRPKVLNGYSNIKWPCVLDALWSVCPVFSMLCGLYTLCSRCCVVCMPCVLAGLVCIPCLLDAVWSVCLCTRFCVLFVT